MKPVATIILNRNLPKPTDKLYQHIKKYDGEVTDIYVVEAGSDKDKLSKYCTWHANWKEATQYGLRYNRGMNFGLSQLWKEKKFNNYEAFFLITNDTELENKKSVQKLLTIIRKNKKIGILSPCSKKWEERKIFGKNNLKFFWYIANNAYFLNKKFLEKVVNIEKNLSMNFLFDGSNFRGFGSELELIAKSYANDFGVAITKEVWCEENETYLKKHSNQIKTESYETNIKLYIDEGLKWMRKKYGFNNKWDMQNHAKTYYDNFFVNYPEFEKYKLF